MQHQKRSLRNHDPMYCLRVEIGLFHLPAVRNSDCARVIILCREEPPMTLSSAVLAILCQLQPSQRDSLAESYVSRVHRLNTVAAAIEAVANRVGCHEQTQPCHRILDRTLAAAVLVEQARRESEYRLDVQLGQCRPHECDRGRARSLWQIHWARQSEPLEQWLGYAGESRESVESAATRAVTLWSGGYYSHRAQAECGFARLATGRGDCDWAEGLDRAWSMRQVQWRLIQLMR